MNRLGSRFCWRSILACATLSLVCVPLLVGAQGPATPAPADTTTAAPADTTTAAPADTTTAAPADTTTTAPADTTTSAPADTTTAAPADTTTSAPADTTTAAPADTTTAAPPDTALKAPAMPDTTQWGLSMSDSARRALRAEVEGQLQQMADSLKLSPQQRDSARLVLLDQAFQLQQLRDKYTAMDRSPANRQAMMKEMQTLRDVSDARLAGVLSGEQMTTYKRMRAEQIAKMRSRMGGQAPPAEKK